MGFKDEIDQFRDYLSSEEFKNLSAEDQEKARREFADQRLLPTILNNSDQIFESQRESGQISNRKTLRGFENDKVAQTLNYASSIQPPQINPLTPEQAAQQEAQDQATATKVQNTETVRSALALPDLALELTGNQPISPQIQETLKTGITKDVFPVGATPEEVKKNEDAAIRGQVLGGFIPSLVLSGPANLIGSGLKAGISKLSPTALKVLLPVIEGLNVNAAADSKLGAAIQGALLGGAEAKSKLKQQGKEEGQSDVEAGLSAVLGSMFGVAGNVAGKQLQQYIKGLKSNISKEELSNVLDDVKNRIEDAVFDIQVDEFRVPKDPNSNFLDDIFNVPTSSDLPESIPSQEFTQGMKIQAPNDTLPKRAEKVVDLTNKFNESGISGEFDNLISNISKKETTKIDPVTKQSINELKGYIDNSDSLYHSALQDLKNFTGGVVDKLKALRVPGSNKVQRKFIGTPTGTEEVTGFKAFLKGQIEEDNKFIKTIFDSFTDPIDQVAFAKTRTNIPQILAQTQSKVANYLGTIRNPSYQHLQDLRFKPSEYEQAAQDLVNKSIDDIFDLPNTSSYNQKLKTLAKFFKDSGSILGIKGQQTVPDFLNALAQIDEDFARRIPISGLHFLTKEGKPVAIDFRDLLDDYSSFIVKNIYKNSSKVIDDAITIATKEQDQFLLNALKSIKTNFDNIINYKNKGNGEALLSYLRTNAIQNQLAFSFTSSLLNGTQTLTTGVNELGIKSIPDAITLLTSSPTARKLLRSSNISEQLLSRMEVPHDTIKNSKLVNAINKRLNVGQFGVEKDYNPFAVTEETNQVYALLNGFIQETGSVGNWLALEKAGGLTEDVLKGALLKGQALNKRYNFVPDILGRKPVKNTELGKWMFTYMNHPLGEAALVSDWIQSGKIDALASYLFMKTLLGGKDGTRVFVLKSAVDALKEQNPELARDLDNSFEVVEQNNIPKKLLDVNLGHKLGVFDQFDILNQAIQDSIPMLSILQQSGTRAASTIKRAVSSEDNGLAPDTPLTVKEKKQDKSLRARINKEQLKTDLLNAGGKVLNLALPGQRIPGIPATIGLNQVEKTLLSARSVEQGRKKYFGEAIDVKNDTIKDKTKSFVQQQLGESTEQADILANKTKLRGDFQFYVNKGVMPPKELFRRSNKTQFELLDNARKDLEDSLGKTWALGFRPDATKEEKAAAQKAFKRLSGWLTEGDLKALLKRNVGVTSEGTGFFLPDNQAADRRRTERFKNTLK